MAKKHRKRPHNAHEKGGPARGGDFGISNAPDGRDGGEITRAGWLIVAVSVLIAAAGYFLLSKASPAGRDMYSNLSPFVILAGYIGIAVGIMWQPGRGEGEKDPASAGENRSA